MIATQGPPREKRRDGWGRAAEYGTCKAEPKTKVIISAFGPRENGGWLLQPKICGHGL